MKTKQSNSEPKSFDQQEVMLSLILKTEFKMEQIPALLNVCSATGNPQVASLILVGAYQEPDIPSTSRDTSQEVNRKKVSYNPFTDEVYYEYNKVESVYGWFLKNLSPDELIEENIVSHEYWSSDAYRETGDKDEDAFRAKYERKIYTTRISDEISQGSVKLDRWVKPLY